MSSAGLLDTSVFIASETGRELDASALPDEMFVSVTMSAELLPVCTRDADFHAIRDLGGPVVVRA